MTLQHWILAIRPKTLPASISPIILGSSLAHYDGRFNLWVFLLALLCALALQVAVNLANDLLDSKSGVDSEKRLGPKRVTQSGLISEYKIKVALGIACSLSIVSGLSLVWLSNPILLLCGFASLLAVFAYSGGPKPLANIAMGEAMVLVFFGWLAVGGTYFVHANEVSWLAFGFGTIAGLMSAAIMLVNNLRDIPTDSVAGKVTLAVVLGEKRSRILYSVMLVCALILHGYLSIYILALDWVNLWPLIVASVISARLIQKIYKRHGAELNSQLAATAKLELIYCVTVGMVLWALA